MYYICYNKINQIMTTIFTVIPYFFDGVEVFQNDVKSFSTWKAANQYASNEIDGRKYDIVENILVTNS